MTSWGWQLEIFLYLLFPPEVKVFVGDVVLFITTDVLRWETKISLQGSFGVRL
jgi:hypothetical protein